LLIQYRTPAAPLLRAYTLLAFACFALHSGCSRSKVDTGQNGQAPDLTGLANGDNGFESPGGCWSSPEKTPAVIEDFCEQIPSMLRQAFAKSLNLVCENRRFLNLLRPECGWDGTGNSVDHLRVVESTPVDDRSTDFFYFSIYALTAGPASFSYPSTLALVATNVEAFKRSFQVPGGAAVSPAGNGIRTEGPLKTFRYSFAVNGLAKFGFVGEVQLLKVDDRLTAVFNRAVDELEGLKSRRNLTLSMRLENGREKLLTIEERLVPDLGQHQIALSKMIKLDKLEMENRYQNSLVREPPPELAGILD
jgi:hypothetical protein